MRQDGAETPAPPGVGERESMERKATIYSIAEALGVSASTVSRAFSRPELVRSEVRALVMAKAAELNYQPNPVARGLITGRTGMVGLLIPDIENPFFGPVVRSVQKAASSRSWNVLLMDSELDPARETSLVTQVRQQVDAFVFVSPREEHTALMAVAGDRPAVFVNRPVAPTRQTASVVVDDSLALHQAADHLRSLGHRDIALLRGPQASWSARERRSAVMDWAKRGDARLVELGPYEALFEGGLLAAAALARHSATAVIAFDDLMALGVISGLARRGVAVPRAVSIVGCDDVLLARTASPMLTTIRPPTEAIGQAVADMLAALLAGKAPRSSLTLSSELVVRDSTAPAILSRDS